MKITIRSNGGSILMVILITIVLTGLTLGSYLNLVSNQNQSIMRSMAWNSAISVAEAGIEEAMAQLNANTTNRTMDGWAIDGTNVWKERTFGTNKYKVFINKDIDPPKILAEGLVRHPKTGEFLNARKIRVSTTNDALFAKGMVAKGQIDLSGNKIKTDSFDSTDPNYSTAGRYDPAKNKDGGDIATNSSVIDSLNVWNADIYGRASTGPGGNIKLGANGAVGSKAWHAAGNSGVEPGWSTDDMNVYFPDVKLPWSGVELAPLSNVTINGTNYAYVIPGGNYQMEDLEISGQKKVLVTGHSTLLITDEFDMSGQTEIIIQPGASLQLYMAGAETKMSGKVVNNSGNAANFSYWGLPSNKQVSFNGNASFTGTIYAPQAFLKLGGGGNDTYDFVGATVSGSIKMNGHFNFHYDESLKAWGPRRAYTITAWHEVKAWDEEI